MRETTLMPNRLAEVKAPDGGEGPGRPKLMETSDKGGRDIMLRRDLKTLATFVRIYCHAKHEGRVAVDLKPLKLNGLLDNRTLELCPDCSQLLKHALVKRTHCPMDPKPACKNCTSHCYQHTYRDKIREVMRFSGTRMLLTGRLDYLWHLFF